MPRQLLHRLSSARLERVHVFLLPLMLLLTGVGLAHRVASLQYQADLERLRESVRVELEPIRGELSRELFGAIHLTEGISSLISVEGGVSETRFEALAAELLQRSDVIRNLAIAPNNVVAYVYPLEGNERAIGLDYSKNPDQSAGVERMMADQKMVVAGPVQLVQGGVGVIGRTPIYVSDAAMGPRARRYWGLASTVIDFPKLVGKTHLVSLGERMEVALRGIDGLGAPGKVFWGNEQLFASSPILKDVVLPSGSWQLAGGPKGGWPLFRAWESSYFLIGNLLAVALAVLLFKLLEVADSRECEVQERRLAEAASNRANRALRLFSLVKGAVVRAKDEDSLLSEVCRISVESAGYRMAWIGRAEQDVEKTVRPVTFSGPGEGFLDRIFVSWGENQHGHGTAGEAIRSRAPAVARDLRTNPAFASWREALETRDFAAAIAVPLIIEQEVFGVLLIYAAEADAFDNTEIELLDDLGNTISHGMRALYAQRQRHEAMLALEQARLELEERVRVRTRELQVAKEAAESADHLKSAFLATMSHELRTPLNSIIGFTGILIEGLAGDLNSEQKKQLGMVQSSAQHLLALITEVLDISKIEAGQLTLSSEQFKVGDSVRAVVEAIRPSADRKGLGLKCHVQDTVSNWRGDRRRFEQIILNLLSNAVKFTEQGEVAIEVASDATTLHLGVRDTGIGITNEEIPRLFQPFHQIDTGLTRRHEGTGLGLSICKRLAELMGGSIQVTSAPGVGSKFTVSLPLGQI